MGVPPSRLDGREPATTATYEYDDAGRLVRSVTTREPRYTERDVAELLALDVYRRSLCPGGCGQSYAESTSDWKTGPAYEAKSTTCRACAELGEAQRGKAEKNPDGAGARMWHVIKSKG